MNCYCKIFDELTHRNDITYTFTGRDGTFLIYAFCKNEETSTIEILDEINALAEKFGLQHFCAKRSIHTPENDFYKTIFVFRVFDTDDVTKLC